ncbi:hypothetical protein [Methylotuvimicrobium sp. KM2]|uniref:hypothetical protein n=1 Tax=Methylotuvimicrobium sp. KM2 TaxID=3133976 RepID=UPI0031011349
MNQATNLFKVFIIVGAMILISPAHASFQDYYDVNNWQLKITPGSDASIASRYTQLANSCMICVFARGVEIHNGLGNGRVIKD